VDVTLVDFAADARAATPSQAAEMVVPDRRARQDLLRRTFSHLARAMRARLAEDHVAIARASRRLGDPRVAIAAHQQLLDDRATRLAGAVRASLARRRHGLSERQNRLAYLHPRSVVGRHRAEVVRLEGRLRAVCGTELARRASDLQRAGSRLDAMSPLKVLGRGYAIATREDGLAIRAAADVRQGDAIHIRVRDASIGAQVTGVEAVQAPRAKE
jgi:exodeoxyribonuclease VII large subunit